MKQQSRRILIAEDDASVRKTLHELVSQWGFAAAEARDGMQAREMFESYRPDIVLLDIKMPRLDGLTVLSEIRRRRPEVGALVISGEGGIADAIRAIRLGADDYLEKPMEPNHLRFLLKRICERLDNSSRGAIEETAAAHQELVGDSPAITSVKNMIEQVAPTSASVVIQGESGTGKELAARMIHRLSPRAAAPYVAINCAALPDTLVESELFGHDKGAFTGADETRKGCFELAKGGTLLLDEITEMKPPLQAKLLRVLEERKLRRLGGGTEIPVDVRVLAASNRSLLQALGEGKLREDLYYRLSVFTITMPSLRERLEDIPALVEHFIARFARESGRAIDGASEDCLKALQSHAWPGNVRQLRNVIERGVAITRENRLSLADLPAEFQQHLPTGPSFEVFVGESLDQVESELIARTIAAFRGNKSRAASVLGISLRTLYNRLARCTTTPKRDIR